MIHQERQVSLVHMYKFRNVVERAVHTCINWKSVCTRSQPSRIVYSTSKIRLMIISRQLKDQFV